MMREKARRPSPLQRRVLIVLAALDEKRPGPVATRDIERVLEQAGDAPVYGPNLRTSCRRMEAAGWLRTLRAPNLQLAVELTDAGRGMATPLLTAEQDRIRAEQRATEVHVLPLVRVKPAYESDVSGDDRLVPLGGRWQMMCRADFVVRLDGSTCLQLWNAAGQVTRLEGDPLQVAQWLQCCHDAGIDVRMQINESHAPEEGAAALKNAQFPGGQAHDMTDKWCRSLLTVLSDKHGIWLRTRTRLKSVASPGRRERSLSVQARFLAVVQTLADTRDALYADRSEAETVPRLHDTLAGFGFTAGQVAQLSATIRWPEPESEAQQRGQLQALLAELATRGIDGDREGLETLIFSPVRRPDETWRGRLQWLLGSPELAKGFGFHSSLARSDAEVVLDWLALTLGPLATEGFAAGIRWDAGRSVDRDSAGIK